MNISTETREILRNYKAVINARRREMGQKPLTTAQIVDEICDFVANQQAVFWAVTIRNDSLAARTDTWLQSFLVWSPGQRDIIKTVALVLMVLDHINLIFQLKQEWMFLVGRGAFPLFALVWGLNLSRHAHIRQPAINRLWGWGIIAQFAYYLAGFPGMRGISCLPLQWWHRC